MLLPESYISTARNKPRALKHEPFLLPSHPNWPSSRAPSARKCSPETLDQPSSTAGTSSGSQRLYSPPCDEEHKDPWRPLIETLRITLLRAFEKKTQGFWADNKDQLIND